MMRLLIFNTWEMRGDWAARRELLDGQCGLGQPLGGQAHADIGPVAAVQEVGIGEDGETRDLDQSGCGPSPGPQAPGTTGVVWNAPAVYSLPHYRCA
jgi:hypothetical protein